MLIMKDSMANNIMAKYGVAGTMPSLPVSPKRKTILPIADGGIKKSKEEEHGYLYPTIQNRATLILESFMEKRIKGPMLEETEVEHNIFDECFSFLQQGYAGGYFTEEQVFEQTNFVKAREINKYQKGASPLKDTAASVLLAYRGEVYRATRNINLWVMDAKVILKDNKCRADLSIKGNKWIIDEVIKKNLVSESEADRISMMIATKDSIIAEYTSKANSHTVGESALGRAAVYAGLYVENLKDEIRREELETKKHYDKKLSAFRFYIQEKEGEVRDPSEGEKAELLASIPPYKHRGFSSIGAMFPIGNKEFLAWAKTGEFRSFKTTPVRSSAYFLTGSELTEEQTSYLYSLVGKEAFFDEGVLLGTDFKISTEDRFDTQAKEAYPTRKDIQKQGYAKTYEEALYRQPFLRGPKVWHGGYQKGTVLFVSVYKSSFKLWLGNFQTV